MHTTPVQALQMLVELHARDSLSMHFAMFAGSEFEALEPIVQLEEAKNAMEMVTGAAGRQGGEDEGVNVVSVGDWWVEGGMGIIDVCGTAVVHVGKTLLSLELSKDHCTIA